MRFSILFFAMAVLSLGLVCAVYGQLPAANSVPRAYGDSEYRLGPDDVLEVFVYKEPDLSTPTVVVRPDGKISLPLIGELPVSGKTATELQKEIAQKLVRFVSDPAVNVIVKEVNSAKVSVMGEVKTPGVYKIKDRATLFDALALAGGFTEYAKRDKVTVYRVDFNGVQQRIPINVEEQIKGKTRDPFYVQPYDKIYVQ